MSHFQETMLYEVKSLRKNMAISRTLYYACTMSTISVLCLLCLYYVYYACTMPTMIVLCLLCLYYAYYTCTMPTMPIPVYYAYYAYL